MVRPIRRYLPILVIFSLMFLVTLVLYSKIAFKQNVPTFETSNIKIPFVDWSNDTTLRPGTGNDVKLAWILHFNYEPHPEVVKILLHFYAKHFVFIAIVCPTGRSEKLLHVDTSTVDAEVVWAPPCPNYLRNAVAGLMMICYSKGLQLLQASSKVNQVNFVVLSNDDVVLNMTKVREFAHDGRPVSHISPSLDAPPMFEPPEGGKGTYFGGWTWGSWWPECQTLFSKVPLEYKVRFLKRFGDKAFKGGVDVFFLPIESVPEFIFLTSIVGECWIEMNIPNALAMLSEPIRFFSSKLQILAYRWDDLGVIVTPEELEALLMEHSILSFHPFKLSYPKHRSAFTEFMYKYKLN